MDGARGHVEVGRHLGDRAARESRSSCNLLGDLLVELVWSTPSRLSLLTKLSAPSVTRFPGVAEQGVRLLSLLTRPLPRCSAITGAARTMTGWASAVEHVSDELGGMGIVEHRFEPAQLKRTEIGGAERGTRQCLDVDGVDEDAAASVDEVHPDVLGVGQIPQEPRAGAALNSLVAVADGEERRACRFHAAQD